MPICEVCKRLSRDFGTLCMPSSCFCNCHKKSFGGIRRATKKYGPKDSAIADAIKRGYGVEQEGTKFKYNIKKDERR